MSFFTLNGLVLPVEVGSASGELLEVNEARRTMQGLPRKERTTIAEAVRADLFRLDNDEAAFVQCVVEGRWHRVPFDFDDNSTDGYLNTGTSSIVNSANAKEGAGYAELGGYSYSWPFALRVRNPRWSVMYWRSTSLPSWDLFIVTSAGLQTKNGSVEATPTTLSELTVNETTGAVEFADTAGVYVDGLVVFREEMTLTQAGQIAAWLAAGNRWTDPPELILDGDVVDDRAVSVIGEVVAADYEQGGVESGWANNIRRVGVELVQSRPEIDTRPPAPDISFLLDEALFDAPPPPPTTLPPVRGPLTGTVVGTLTDVAGVFEKYGRALSGFTFANHIKLPQQAAASLGGNPFVTVEAWVKADTATGNHCILNLADASDGYRCSLYFKSGELVLDARARAADTQRTATGTSSPTVNVWHHVGAVVDVPGDRIKLYLDGREEADAAADFGSNTWFNGDSFDDCRIGYDNGVADFAWSGVIARVGIHFRKLSEGEFARIYELGKRGVIL